MRIRSGSNIFASNEAKRQAILKYSSRLLSQDRIHIVKKEVCDEYNLDEIQATTFLAEVKEIIAETTAMNNETIIAIHTDIYEDIYKRFSDLDFTKGALMALERKEKLLNLHQEDQNEVVINNQNNITVNESNYDTDKLSQSQQDRLTYLLNKTKGLSS